MKVRSVYQLFMDAVQRYLSAVVSQVKQLQVSCLVLSDTVH